MRFFILFLLLVLSARADTDKRRLSSVMSAVQAPIFTTMSWARDPFFPSRDRFELKGIISNQMAFINGRWIKKGERIDDYELAEISLESVTLRQGDENFVLQIGKTKKGTEK